MQSCTLVFSKIIVFIKWCLITFKTFYRGPDKSTYTFSVTFCFLLFAKLQWLEPAGGKRKSADIKQKAYMLIYPDPFYSLQFLPSKLGTTTFSMMAFIAAISILLRWVFCFLLLHWVSRFLLVLLLVISCARQLIGSIVSKIWQHSLASCCDHLLDERFRFVQSYKTFFSL
jgi:hypothetical protein